ncbi:MAG: sigma-54-dependent transcriptional regulator [Pseudomonadales bacterium]
MPNTHTILVVEDDNSLREALVDTLELHGYDCMQAPDGVAALQELARKPVSMVVSDVNMPEMDGMELLKNVRQKYPHIPMVLLTAYGCIASSVEAMRAGAADYIVKPFEPGVLLELIADHLGHQLGAAADESVPIAVDPRSQKLLSLADRVAGTEATIMITGESGTGKEVLARYVHSRSNRADQTFVALNCAAIPENMLEAILFGHEKGAFTGAHQSAPGKFEQANGGTLLLDEISEMHISLQAKLLRVLQEQEVERIGGRKTIALDVRVLATSNRDMQVAVAAGEFREDLYYRLNVFPLHLHALRKRPDDILPLAEHLLAKHARKMGRAKVSLDESAMQRLVAHHWPGNIRELDNVMQRALILQPEAMINGTDICVSSTESIGFDAANDDVELPVSANDQVLPGHSQSDAPSASGISDLESNMQNKEFELVEQCLRSNNYNRQQTAAELGVSERTLRYKLSKMRALGIIVDRKSLA